MKEKLHRILFALALILSLTVLLTACSHRHDYNAWKTKKEPTCTEDGEKIRTCYECDHENSKKIPATGHQAGQWIIDKEASCTEEGSKHQECAVCSASIQTETLPALGAHNYTEKVTTPATCVSAGTKTYTCSQCSDTYTESFPCQTYSATELYERNLNSVGEIITYDQNGKELALGTGFVTGSNGVIITNYHVIEDAYSAAITINGTRYTVDQVLAYDKTIDVAVLKVLARNLPAVSLCKQNHNVGEAVYAFGSSKGLTATFSEGIITYSNRILDGVSYTQHDAPISSGNSGGPLINKYGEVIGINTWTVRDSQNLNFAINVAELDKLNYSNPMTMAELYNKECNVFIRMKNYIIQNGFYDSSDEAYCLVTDEFYSSDYTIKYTRMAYYYLSNNSITLDLAINGGTDWVYFNIEEDLSGAYYWEYFDEDDNEMSGTLYASTYDDDTWLGYSYNNIYYSSIRDSVRKLASSMVNHICSNITKDFSAIGVTASDLGFILYP